MTQRLPQLALVILVLYWVVLFIATHIPDPGVGETIPGGDKVVHFLAYAALAWMAATALRLWQVRMPAILLIVLMGGVVYGAIDEWLQTLSIVGRQGSVYDWLADVGGVCAGLFLFLWTQRLARRFLHRQVPPA